MFITAFKISVQDIREYKSIILISFILVLPLVPKKAINPSGPGIPTDYDTSPSDSHGILINPSVCAMMTDVIEITVALTAYILLFVTAIFYFWKTFPAACSRARSQSWKICCFSHSLQPNLPTTNYAIQIGRNNTRKHVFNTGFIIWFHYNNLISNLSYFRVLEDSLKMFSLQCFITFWHFLLIPVMAIFLSL